MTVPLYHGCLPSMCEHPHGAPQLPEPPTDQREVRYSRQKVAHSACHSVELKTHPKGSFPVILWITCPLCLHVLLRFSGPLCPSPPPGGGSFWLCCHKLLKKVSPPPHEATRSQKLPNSATGTSNMTDAEHFAAAKAQFFFCILVSLVMLKVAL